MAVTVSLPVASQTFPTKPITMVVVFSTGRTGEIVGRHVANLPLQELGDHSGDVPRYVPIQDKGWFDIRHPALVSRTHEDLWGRWTTRKHGP